jgi:uncharacterized protein YeaO (DUF488 family)
MPIKIVQLGSARSPNEGVRIGTVRRPPRGVPKRSHGKRDFYDVWLPNLAPSSTLLRRFKTLPDTPLNWIKFAKRYEREIERPSNVRILDLLAALSKTTNFSVGCYCEDERKCHRSILKKVLKRHGARF